MGVAKLVSLVDLVGGGGTFTTVLQTIFRLQLMMRVFERSFIIPVVFSFLQPTCSFKFRMTSRGLESGITRNNTNKYVFSYTGTHSSLRYNRGDTAFGSNLFANEIISR